MKIGFIALGRPTFDLTLAGEMARAAFDSLGRIFEDVAGDPIPVVEGARVQARVRELSSAGLEAVVVFQATFADSTLVSAVARAGLPLVLWAVPEDRKGGRLRLNSLCGINLAAYVLAKSGTDYRWIYRHPSDPELGADLKRALTGPSHLRRPLERPTSAPGSTLDLTGMVVGLVGQRPEGFEPCDYDPDQLRAITGVAVDQVPIEDWFDSAGVIPQDEVSSLHASLASRISGIDDVDADSLAKSLRLSLGLEHLARSRSWDGVATRCWPECFTDFGGAACAGNSLLSSAGTPACCEADIYGNVTALILQKLSGQPPFVADLVDIHRPTNTGAFWHCGMAPVEMADPKVTPRATNHSNRRKPLLYEFALRPGRVTLARLSQAKNQIRLLVGGGEMLDEPLPYSGTSGVVRFDVPAEDVLDTIMGEGLEHHYGIAYGDHREGLRSYAAHIGVPVIDL